MTHFRRTFPHAHSHAVPALLAFGLLLSPASLTAQVAGAGPAELPTVPDTSYAAGYAAGDSLAAETPLRGGAARFFGGVAGGVLLAPGALFLMSGQPELLLPGAGVVMAAAELSPTEPPSAVPDSSRALDAAYVAGFEEGFRDREGRKRRITAWGAAGASAAATLGLLLVMFLGSGYT